MRGREGALTTVRLKKANSTNVFYKSGFSFHGTSYIHAFKFGKCSTKVLVDFHTGIREKTQLELRGKRRERGNEKRGGTASKGRKKGGGGGYFSSPHPPVLNHLFTFLRIEFPSALAEDARKKMGAKSGM